MNRFPAFLEKNPNALFFRGGNNHWSVTGQNLAAQIAAKRIAEELL
jgi:hypothetical protein